MRENEIICMLRLWRKVKLLGYIVEDRACPNLSLSQLQECFLQLLTLFKFIVEHRLEQRENFANFAAACNLDEVDWTNIDSLEAELSERPHIYAQIKPLVMAEEVWWDPCMQGIYNELFRTMVEDKSTFGL